jgi:hypothetical protein
MYNVLSVLNDAATVDYSFDDRIKGEQLMARELARATKN